ncbi:protein BANP-like [Tropilaelaps mercedesae]|uniref:Protein BANP n=1 Tax=Tropilaelaps mercedesae TaxID=418985 RepID=A0A1V9X3D9_9ACAR|nr:protein BANP-like [Tropilaelaps mercedesae]
MEIGKLTGSSTDPDEILSFLRSFRDELLDRLGVLENRVATLGDRCRRLEDRSRGCRCCARLCDPPDEAPSEFRANGAGGKSADIELGKDGSPYFVHNGSVLLSSLNSHSDYPQGSWLGDDSDPRRRVRVPIEPKVLLNANSTCRSPEKMALKLLDLLFDREVQANGNISGSSKYGKQKLNPVFIYGILCHLVYLFKITAADWERIKLSIDSKCRSALRRKRKALEIQRPSVPPAPISACLNVCSGNSHLPAAGCAVGPGPTNGHSLNDAGLGGENVPCLDGPKDSKQACPESPRTGQGEPQGHEHTSLIHQHNKSEQTPALNGQPEQEPGGHTASVSSAVAGGFVSASVEESCPPLLRADSFEFNDLLSDGQADPDDPEEPEVVNGVISLDGTVVSDELMSSVSECGGYLEVLQVSPETMLALQQTHRVQMQSDGTLIAMPLIISTAGQPQTPPDGVSIQEENSANKDADLVESQKRLSL